MDFLNRDKQRNLLKHSLDNIQRGIEQCIWVEGSSGTGKSYFVKYMKTQENPPVFTFDDYSWLYKCASTDINNEFSYITAIASDLQIKHPKEFNNFLIKYFNKINNISWIEVLVHLIPNIKCTEWAKDVIENSSKEIIEAKNDISSKLYAQGLPKFFAELIIYMLRDVEKEHNVLFCIDDACWLDTNSIKTINIMLNMLAVHSKSDFKISYAIITRGKEELEKGNSNYETLENVLKDYFETIQYIYIKNFDPTTTKKYVEMMGKNILLKKTTVIYKMTNGNPQELYQALKIEDDDLLELCERQKSNTLNRQMSNELIYNLINKNVCVLPILACISLVHTKLSASWLLVLVRSVCNSLQIPFNSSDYDNGIILLKENDLISDRLDYVIIVHDSIKESIISFLRENGEYYSYMDSISQGLKLETEFPNLIKEVFCLFSEYNPQKCFDYFVEMYSLENTLDADIYKVIAESLIREGSLFNPSNLDNYIIPVILKECTFLSLYDIAYELCCIIYPLKEELKTCIKFQYLILFSKILIDMALLNKDDQYNAIDIIDEALQINNLTSNEKMEAYLLAMSAYEHILDFDNIMLNKEKAKQLYTDDSVSNYLKAMFLRNQGLVCSHIDLKSSYKKAIDYAGKIHDTRQKNLMLGTCNNNLGLSYWYSNDIGKAKDYFFKAKHYLESIGYDIFRVLNNISMCYLLEGDLSNAYTYLLQAKALNIECIFEKLCIQSNLSVIEWKAGQKDSAKRIANNLYDEYKSGLRQTSDELVYCSAMVNLGYFHFCEAEYLIAAEKYNNSQFFKYRYNNEEQLKKRQAMVDACLSRAGILPSEEVTMDLNDSGQNVFKCMYAPITFAYYII